MNKGITTALVAISITQIAKPPLEKLKTGKWNWSALLETGGMPSSHSAAVTSLATYIALKKGFNSAEFSLSTIFGMLVMYDAAGIRRHAGEIAIEVNELDQEVEKLAGKEPGLFHQHRKKRLKERLGHQPCEVIGGSILGIVVGSISYYFHRTNLS